MSDSCVTTGALAARSSQITRKQSVRFAGKPDVNRKEGTATEKYLNSTNIIKVKGANIDIMVSSPTEEDVTNAHSQMMDQMESEQLITSNITLIGINEIDMEFAVKKKSNHAGTSRKFPFILSDEIMAFICCLRK